MSDSMLTVSMRINGSDTEPADLPEDLMLLEYLQEYLNLTGTRYGCGQGVCRACAVIHDGANGPEVIAACITGVAWANGRSFRTIEGHASRDIEGNVTQLTAVQQAFLDHFSFQCSYCTPGFVAAATALVERLEAAPVARDAVEETVLNALNPNICRCTGYVRYLEATRDVILSTPGLTTEEVAERDAQP
ncbi:(2Fe-2S)-binding protein [Pararhodobacter oceanensis]|uniref:(2Fe-2S)-binding protein n=1 Tax=Pararhodobacter oceanensis TaxID=2172121 RepID=A0A2T8HPT6_9RHOB|nr:(2Fe-2S)-binding protein [Pararhodobacter oceanensis]PVH27454.1 (2Fe-2S)-binding protein [Pararhodobacter oceanensis]